MDGKLKFKADLNDLNELEKILMSNMQEQLNILNNKIEDVNKSKNHVKKLETALKKLQDFVLDQLANL